MPKFKINVDKKGNFYTPTKFKLVEADMIGAGSDQSKVFIKLLQPKDAHIKVLTLTINKKTLNAPAVQTGKLITIGPFPMVVGDNAISFEGTSDQPEETLEFEVIPQLLK
jgi:hypothetical protein